LFHVPVQRAHDDDRRSPAECHCCDLILRRSCPSNRVYQKTLIMLTDSDVIEFDFQVFVARCSGGKMLSYFHAMLDRLRSETKEQGQTEV
jgi:hypothetical protein